MPDLSAFPITRRWPAAHPDRIQLYSLPTPNGVKASIMLEEIGLPYEPHFIDIGADETWTPEYLPLNPNGKIPAIFRARGGRTIRTVSSIPYIIVLSLETSPTEKQLPRATETDSRDRRSQTLPSEPTQPRSSRERLRRWVRSV